MFGASQPPWYLLRVSVEDMGAGREGHAQLPHVVRRLVVPADDDGEDGRGPLACVVPARARSASAAPARTQAGALVEVAELLVLGGHGHAAEVLRVARRLEVAADEERVDGVAVLLLERAHARVDRVQLAVAAALDGDLRVRRF
jgi:hypothetical protein